MFTFNTFQIESYFTRNSQMKWIFELNTCECALIPIFCAIRFDNEREKQKNLQNMDFGNHSFHMASRIQEKNSFQFQIACYR